MELGEICRWYLVRVRTEFAVQYYGDEQEEDFPPGLNGNWILESLLADDLKMSN
jgi:hypothetical protein